MMKSWGLAVLAGAVLLAACGGGQIRSDVKNMEKTDFARAEPVVDDGRSPFPNVPLVSLGDLVCSPEKYDGKLIRVQGIPLIEPRNNNLFWDLFPKQVGSCGRLMIGMDYPADFLRMAKDYDRRRMEFVGIFQRNLCTLEKYKYARVNDPKDPSQFICKSVELRSDAFLTSITGWRIMPQ